ncbi:MAG: MerC domain-containing protein [Sphingomonas sp.]|nr:MerC domain-containing protein [Sphingomonas sp.]
MARKDDLIEGIAVGATIACLIHCVGLPLLIAAVPLISEVLPIPAHFHLIALALAIPATAGALVAGYRRHRLAVPLIAGMIGLALLALGATHWEATPLETPVTILGSLAIAAAHLTNWRFRRASYHEATA